MIERVVENWLTKVNERSFEVPFCQLLAGEGYQIVHLSRHGPFEEGKDILAIAPDGTPCAFQLKGTPGGKITQKAWEEHLPQITRLVEIPINHPSIDPSVPRRVYLVTNGELDEEVRLEIQNRNPDWLRRGHPQLETIVKGQLLSRFKSIHTNFWPVQLSFEKSLLEFFLTDGSDCLPKDKFVKFLLSLIPIFEVRLNKAECSRALASAAILNAYALSAYTEKSNHIALIEGWTIYLACLVALVEKHNLKDKYWKDSLTICKFAIEQSFSDLKDELESREHLVEGNGLVDGAFYRGRVTWLAGLMSTFVLWKRLSDPNWLIDDWYKKFISSHQKDLILWGEAAVPQFLMIFWFFRQITATIEPEALLVNLIEGICSVNEDNTSNGLADPYHDLTEVMEEKLGLANNRQPENYRGRSFVLEPLVHLFARRGWRQRLRFMWSKITRIHFAEFNPPSRWQFCLWEVEEGRLNTVQPKMPQSWAELRNLSRSVDTSMIPELFQKNPELLLVFIVVYPHRLTKDVAKFLDDLVGYKI